MARDLKLVIFDCDGVLVDSEPIINQAHAHVLTACGYPITERDLVERFCGMSDPEMLGIIEHQWGRALPAFYAERVGLMIEAGFHQSLAAIDGVAEVLDAMPVPVCVASSSSPEQIRHKLELTGLLRRFGENLFSAAMVARGKPAPDLFLYAARHLRTAPDRCLVVEDSPAGIDAAVAAGMTAIGFSGGSHCGPEHGARLQARGAALVISDMHELATDRGTRQDCRGGTADDGGRLRRPCTARRLRDHVDDQLSHRRAMGTWDVYGRRYRAPLLPSDGAEFPPARFPFLFGCSAV
ncbi:MAG: HAD family hydrolase [Alphaproteobacteria bacterium]|nr:HAD family hydrolase [Alphaproteobacteria bacterium]